MAPAPVDITIPDLAGRRALVTGASDGMGLLIAARLAAAGAELVLPVRDPRKGEAALARIREAAPDAQVSLAALDLSSLAAVRALGEQLRAAGDPFHLLIANAGVMQPPQRQETADGFELQLGTNHLGHTALMMELLPLLRAGRARVVSQISIAARSGRIGWEDLQSERSYDGGRAYAASKIAQGLFALELERRSREGGWGITSLLSHPGVAPTNLLAARPELGRDHPTLLARAIRWASARGIVVGTVASAGLPALMAGTDAAARPGVLYGPMGPGRMGGAPAAQPLFRPLRDLDEARRVWDASLDLTGAPAPA